MRVVDRPRLLPFCTMVFRATGGPVVDTDVVMVRGGRVYMGDRELAQVAAAVARSDTNWPRTEAVLRTAGWVTPAEHLAALAERDDRIAVLEAEVSAARPVIDHIRAFQGATVEQAPPPIDNAPADEPEPEPLQDANPGCTATKKNGQPCTAQALPGRDVCLAHSRMRAAA